MATGVNYSHRYYINGLDLWLTFGIVVEAGNLAELERIPNRKEQWMNNWPDENGTQRYTDKAFFESKTMNLSFVFICDNKAEYLRNSNRFKEFITVGGASGYFELDCILNGKKYKLLYSGNDSVEVLTPINNYPFANAVARYSFNVIDDLLTGVNGGESNMLDADQFISVWNTRNISEGSSAVDTVTLPLVAGVSDFTVDWGDGTPIQRITNNTATHKYATAGIYTVKVKGVLRNFAAVLGSEGLKITDIISWGKLMVSASSFEGCSNLEVNSKSGIPIFTGTNLYRSFFGCAKLKSIRNLSLANTSNVQQMNEMFLGCSLFDGVGVSNWNVLGLINANGFMGSSSPVSVSTETLNNIYSSWSKQSLVKRNVSISFGSAKYSASGKVGRDILVNNFNWTITDGGII